MSLFTNEQLQGKSFIFLSIAGPSTLLPGIKKGFAQGEAFCNLGTNQTRSTLNENVKSFKNA